MTRIGMWLGGTLLMVLLSGCLGKLIPDQDANNLYGFNNFRIDMEVRLDVGVEGMTATSGSSASAVIAQQADSYVAAGTVSRVVDTSLEDLPFDPTSLSESVRPKVIRLFAAPTVIAGQAITDVLPASLSLTSATFDILFTDGNMELTKLFEATFDPSATLERNDASCTSTRCDYLPADEVGASLTVGLGVQDVVKTLAILMSNLNPKTASGEAVIGLGDDPLLANVDRARLTIETFDGVISFK